MAAYFLNLFSPQTYEAFKRSSQEISGFRERQIGLAERISPGDKLICYLTKVGRWFAVLEVISGPFRDDTPIFLPESDPFVIRFKVRPVVLLDVEKAVPIREGGVWNTLSFTKEHDPGSNTWTGKIRNSLNPLDEPDGQFLEDLLLKQAANGATYPIDEALHKKLVSHMVRRVDRDVPVTLPEHIEAEELLEEPLESVTRESHQIQALIADIGALLGMAIWIPKSDRAAVTRERHVRPQEIVERLPLNYDDVTLGTIENIDVLWLQGRSIARAFEVEHTTSIYSGLLRMADLLALQPNMNIRLHIVAPDSKREKVFQEIRRPVFSLLEHGALADHCTYLSYESLRELADQKHLEQMKDTVIDEYAEDAE